MVVPSAPTPLEPALIGEQLVGFKTKFGLVRLTGSDGCEADASDDLGNRVREGGDVGVEGIDVHGYPHDHGSVVIGTGQGRGDRHEAQGAPLNGPAIYIFPTAWKGWVPGPAATLVVPTSELDGHEGIASSVLPVFWEAEAMPDSGQ